MTAVLFAKPLVMKKPLILLNITGMLLSYRIIKGTRISGKAACRLGKLYKYTLGQEFKHPITNVRMTLLIQNVANTHYQHNSESVKVPNAVSRRQ
jgi:hypothetical protein